MCDTIKPKFIKEKKAWALISGMRIKSSLSKILLV